MRFFHYLGTNEVDLIILFVYDVRQWLTSLVPILSLFLTPHSRNSQECLGEVIQVEVTLRLLPP